MSTLMPPKPPPPKPPAAPAAPPPVPGAVSNRKFTVNSGRKIAPQRILIYGTAAIGKSELAANIAKVGIRPVVIDLEEGSNHIDVERISGIDSFEECRAVLQDNDLLSPYGALVIDSGTRGQEFTENFVVRTFKTEKGASVKSLGEFSFGKGLEHVYDSWLLLMSDLDANIRRGRHVIVVCHQCAELVPNAAGEDYLQYQPRLQLPKSGKNSIRHRMIEWSDHVFYIGYDRMVEDRKATGGDSRAIYTSEHPSCVAKSRTMSPAQIPYKQGEATLWENLFDSLKEQK